MRIMYAHCSISELVSTTCVDVIDNPRLKSEIGQSVNIQPILLLVTGHIFVVDLILPICTDVACIKKRNE